MLTCIYMSRPGRRPWDQTGEVLRVETVRHIGSHQAIMIVSCLRIAWGVL